jgi:hypothetical protein
MQTCSSLILPASMEREKNGRRAICRFCSTSRVFVREVSITLEVQMKYECYYFLELNSGYPDVRHA